MLYFSDLSPPLRYNMGFYSGCVFGLLVLFLRSMIDKWRRPLRLVTSICCTRVLLNIRGAYFTHDGTGHELIGQENQTFRWGLTGATNTNTMVYSFDCDTLEQAGGYLWTWNDDPNTQLTLRPISPFHCELPSNI